MFTDNLLRDVKIGLRVLVKERTFCSPRGGGPGARDCRRHDDAAGRCGKRRAAARASGVPERRPPDEPQLRRPLQRDDVPGGDGQGSRATSTIYSCSRSRSTRWPPT